MAQYDGAIIIQTDINTEPFDKGIHKMEASAKGFSSNLSSIFKGVGASLAGAFTIKEFASFTGIMTDLESRARLVSKGMEDTSVIMNRLREIADRAYSPFEATATAFMNNATALNALGMSMKEQLDLTEALTNALVISGAKGEQFELVMNAINRSLATGVMKSQELQIVQKYGGAVAESLADALGTTVLGLKNFSKTGEITAAVIKDALIGNLDDFIKKADDMPATIGDALIKLRTQMMFTAAELDKAFEITPTTVKAIDTVRDSILAMQAPLEVAVQVGTAFFVTLLGAKAINAALNFAKATAASTKAIIAETQAEKTAMAIKGQAATASTKYGTVALTQAKERQAAAKLILQAAREEALANLEDLQTARAAMAVKVQKIQTMMVEAEAYHRLSAAKVTGAAQTAVLLKMDRELAALSLQLSSAQTGLALSTSKVATAQAALVTSSSRTAVALAGLKATGSSVLAFFGGPWGAAFMAAAAAVYLLSGRQTEGEKATEKYGAEIDKLRKKYNLLVPSAEEAAEAIEKVSKTELAIEIEKGTASLEKQVKEFVDILETMAVFLEGTWENLAQQSGEALTALQVSTLENMKGIVEALKSGNTDITPAIVELTDAFKELDKLGIAYAPALGFHKKLEDLSLGMEATANEVDANRAKINASIDKLFDASVWDPILNREQTFSERLVSQLETLGVRVKGLKLLDLTGEIASLEKSQIDFQKVITGMTAAIDAELADIRAKADEAFKMGADIPQAVADRELQLIAQRIQINKDMYDALAAQRATFVAQERMALETDLNNKKLAVSKELAIRKKAAEDIVAAMGAQGAANKEVLQAIINVTAASDTLGAAQKDVAAAALAAAQAELQAEVAIQTVKAAAAAAAGDMATFATATMAAAAALAALGNLKDFKFELPAIKVGGGGGRKGGGLNEQKKALEEIELILARLSGDFEKIAQIEANQELEKFIELTKKAGLSSAEAAAKIEEFKEKQSSAIKTEHLQTLISFYDELRLIIPLANEKFIEMNALLIEQKAQALLAAGATAELVEEWKKWMQLATSTEWQDGIKRGALAFIKEWGDAAKVAEKTFDTMIQGVQDLGSGVIDAIFGDAEFRADKFLKDLAKKFLQLAMNQAIANLLKVFFGETAHTGGIVGADVVTGHGAGKFVSPFVFADAKKYHTGGIATLSSSEVPAILQRGEGVFTQAQMRALAPVDRQVELKQTIEVINPPGVPLKADVQTRQASDGTSQTSIILKSIEDGLANRMRTGESKLSPTLEGRYSLNPAKGRHLRTGQ